MALSIDWPTKVINVPKADLTLIQASPTEIRQLDLDAFRLELKSIEASEEGIPFLDTHQHNPPVTVGGVTLARVVEIINGYTVTFEDGQYAVNLVGANSNVGDVVNVNQVSVRSSNSAGLISSAAIEFSSFNGGVLIDQGNISGKAEGGTVFPRGTEQIPSSNLSDTNLIASTRGFTKIYVKGDLNIHDASSWVGFEFVGESPLKSYISISSSAAVLNCEFYNATVSGVLDGNSQIERSVISSLDFVDGHIFESSLGPDPIKLGTSTTANIFGCYSTIPGTLTPTIDMNGSGILALRDYTGGIKLTNYNSTGSHSIDLASGKVILDSTSITSGTFVLRGVGKTVDENGTIISSGTWNGGVTIVNEMLNLEAISDNTVGLTVDQATYLHEIWQNQGLDLGNPLTISTLLRQFSTVSLNITDNGNGSVTVSRA